VTNLGYKDKLQYHDLMRKQYENLHKRGFTLPFLRYTKPDVILEQGTECVKSQMKRKSQ